jgi:hypothetical protein
MATASTFCKVVDALGNVEGLTPPAFGTLVKCAAVVLLAEAPAPVAPAANDTSVVKPRKRPGPKPGSKRKSRKDTGRGSEWRRLAALKTVETKNRLKAEREAATKSALAVSGDAVPVVELPAAAEISKPKKKVFGRYDPRIAPARTLLQAQLAENDFIPVDELQRLALERGIDGAALASAAAYLRMHVVKRNGAQGFVVRG